MNWGTLKLQIRRLLVDPAGKRWTDEQLLDFVAWSLDTLCAHTAIATATSFTCDGTTKAFPVPDNTYEKLDVAGALYLDDGCSLTYLNPVHFNLRETSHRGYFLLPESQINLINLPSSSDTLVVEYFAYYPHPVLDSDLILAPSWAMAALNYRVAAHAFSPLGGKSANIRQWGQKPDTGKPTDNPLQDQSSWYFSLYDQELLQYPRQERHNYHTTSRLPFYSRLPR